MAIEFKVILTERAQKQLDKLIEQNNIKVIKAVQKALKQMKKDLRHPSLETHRFYGYIGQKKGDEIFESYAENNTTSAHRLFCHYGPGRKIISIIATLSHP